MKKHRLLFLVLTYCFSYTSQAQNQSEQKINLLELADAEFNYKNYLELVGKFAN